MNRILTITILFVFLLAVQTQAEENMETLNLMPVPAKLSLAGGQFRLTDQFTIRIEGKSGDRIFRGATRALRRLSSRTGLFFPQNFIRSDNNPDSADFVIRCNRKGKLVLHEDESYHLQVSPDGIRLTSETDVGALHGLETFLQLLDADESGYFFPAVAIDDAPRFPWRGLLIDVGRHFMPVDVIKRNLDGMAALKLNVFHWHLTEDQGFRVECKTFPKLHLLGSDGLYYTQEQIKDIIAYAADRGIRVMPEFDMPGHATSWFVGYTELASAPGPYTIERTWGVKDPTMDPTREETYQFLEKFLKEMAELFPDEYVHIGGDENNGKQWDANPHIQAFMKAHNLPDNHALQGYFNVRILKILKKNHKKMVGWDEIFRPDLPKDIVIQSWRGQKALIEAAKKGYHSLLSNGYYIDLIHPAKNHYLNDPLPAHAPLTDDEKKNIFGGEATMWAEFVTLETIDSRIWPRTAAIAERFWSPASVRDVDDMYRRLAVVSVQLENLGLQHEKNYPMMLRRLTRGHDITALKTFVDVVEPVKNYRRGSLREYTSYSPMTRVVDAARPDARVAREFCRKVEAYVNGDRTQEKELRAWLLLWRDNHEKLKKTIRISPVLKEIESMSRDLSDLAAIGLEALDAIESHKTLSEAWVQKSLARVKEARTPRGEAELVILPGIKSLIKAAS